MIYAPFDKQKYVIKILMIYCICSMCALHFIETDEMKAFLMKQPLPGVSKKVPLFD